MDKLAGVVKLQTKTIEMLKAVCAVLCSLTEETKKMLMQYGSRQITNIKFRDNFIMIGQKGLSMGSALEKVCINGSL